MNVVDVEAAALEVCDAIRQGGGPCLMECHTYRFRGHSMFDTQLYRNDDEIKEWTKKGPVVQLTSWLKANDQLSDDELNEIDMGIDSELAEAIAFAENSQFEPVGKLTDDVYAAAGSGAEVSYGDN